MPVSVASGTLCSMTDRTMGPSRRETDCGSVMEQDILTNRLIGVEVRIRLFKHGLVWGSLLK
jgi:hypothetical protein